MHPCTIKTHRNTLSGLKHSRKKWKHSLLNLARPLWHLVRIHGPLPFFGPSSFMCWVTGHLRSSFALALPPLTQILPPTQILPLPPLPPPQSPLKEGADATGKPNTIYTSQQVGRGVTSCS